MEQAVTCLVCLKVYQQGLRDPLVLPCGHTFCRECLAVLHNTSAGTLVCPTCRRDSGDLNINQLPICYPLVSLSSNYSFIKFGSCRNHNEEQRYWCEECELPLCSLCLYTDHQFGHRVQPTRSAMDNKIRCLNTQMTQLRGEVAQDKEEISHLHDYLTSRIKQVLSLEEKVQLLSADVEDAGSVDDILACEDKMKTLIEDNETRLASKKIEKRLKDIKPTGVKLTEKVTNRSESQMALQEYKARRMRIDYREGRLLLHSTAHPASGHLSIKVPSEVFLELGVGGICLGRVYISLRCHLRRAQQFLALCMGTIGSSYVGSCFSHVAYQDKEKETLCCKEYWTECDGPGTRELLTDLEWGDKYNEEPRPGLLIPLSKFVDQHGFGICTIGKIKGTFPCPFGEVVAGMEVVRVAVQHNPVTEVTITHCGVVLPDPSL